MGVVRGSRQERLSLVRYDPWLHFWRVVCIFLLAVAIAVGCFFAGQYASLDERRTLAAERNQLQIQIMAAEKELTSYSQRVAVLEKGGDVDRQAAEGIRLTVKELKAQVAVLEEEVSFYKGIMVPSDKDKGLRISKIDIQPLDQANKYRYSIMLTQVADNSRYIKGLAAVNLVGDEGGVRKIITLRELDEKVDELGVKFSFRYFQEIVGEISIPAHFNVEQVQVVLQSSGSKAQRVEETIKWTK